MRWLFDLAPVYVYGTTSSVVYVTVTLTTMSDGADNPIYKYANMMIVYSLPAVPGGSLN